ncbi:MAG TPA: hypothetical protein VK508_15250 [Cyclobacteriaceae bacterium]|nr:hypothetical protein [Cyclobacteriaceae bacterium]
MRFLGFLFIILMHVASAQQPGVVEEIVKCKADPKQTYALYVPKNYSPSDPPGLILIFDPGARGKMPVGLYKDIANKYNVVLACSNNSRNGPVEESMIAGDAVFTDVISNFSINKNFILTSGFSGGGRTAVEIASGSPKLFSGVITCGAAFSSQKAITREKPVYFAEVIGRSDMNYQEAITAEKFLGQLNNPHTLIMFDGGHQWPPPAAYEEALAWHYLRITGDNLIAQAIHSWQLKNATAQIDSGYLYEANRMLIQMKRDFQQPNLLSKTETLVKTLNDNRNLKSQLKDVARMDERERSLQKDLGTQYVQHIAYTAPDSAFHPEYWRAFRRDCDKLIGSGDKYKILAGSRLVDFGWRMCAEQHYIYMEYDQFRQAAMAARIWSLIQPARPDPCVQAAKAFALHERRDQMMEYLKMAVARGLKDKQAVLQDRAFAKYMKDEAFLNLMTK